MQFAADGMSTLSESEIGLPVSSVSSSASSSRLASSSSANLSSTFLRAFGAACAHAPLRNAARALATARSTSPCSPDATAPSDLPVAGLMLSNVAPLAAGANLPSMNTCERGLIAAARACQSWAEMLGCADMMSSERGRGGGGDDLTHLAPDVAEPMRRRAGEIVGITRFEHARLPAHGELDLAAHDDAALFAAMGQHVLAGGSAGLVALGRHRALAARGLRRDQPQGSPFAADLDQLVRRVENLGRARDVQREELRHGEGNAVEHFFERTHRGADPVLLDQRDQAVGDARATRQLALRQAMHFADVFEARADRSEERRVGKECRSRGCPDCEKKK